MFKAPMKWLLKGPYLYASFRFPAIRFDAPALLSFSGCTHAHAKCPPVPPRDISSWTICPSTCSSLGIGWLRGAQQCRVPPGLSKHASRGKTRKADRGISKSESKAILKQTRVFVPVGFGEYTFRAYFSVF